MYILCVFLLIASYLVNINYSANIPQISFEISENYYGTMITKPKHSKRETCGQCRENSYYRIYPNIIKKRKGYSLNLFNTEKYLRITECAKNQEGSPCLSNRLLNTYPYQTQCLQQITNITLPLYNIDTNKVQGYLISYPSACECSVVNSGYNNSTN
ncbi:hypothetical protein GWI33_015609 [Rhynchophorus ferrugineus]|uniref:Spaetzle domain-containing protein n=1 Tax=Rhynchophorus ferrugineus TaxID=354439 RepID=A0A834I337_RHYFE|nr:hypothetical protein GWI33_015609 [Rhynchophorus ferrugineus]